MSSRRAYDIIGICGFLAGCYAVGAFLPSGLAWGFHFLSFLPPLSFVLYLAVAITGILFVLMGRWEPAFDRLAAWSYRRPAVFLIPVCVMFFLAALLLRVKIPLLGDSFVLLNVYENSYTGVHGLPATREPGALLFFYGFIKLLKVPSYPGILDAFLVGEMLLGAGFLVLTLLIVRSLFADPAQQLMAFLFAIALPYMQLFFGYAELYAVVLFVHSLLLLVVLSYLREKVSFVWVAVIYGVEAAVTYLGAVLFAVPFLYLAYREYQSRGLRTILWGIGILILCGFIALASVDFHIEHLFPPSEHSHLLTLAPTGDMYQAYTIFSPYHFVDVGNLLLLMAAPAILLVAIVFRRRRRELIGSAAAIVLLLGSGMLFLFIAVAKFDLPLAIDWDVTAPFFYFLAIWAVAAVFGSGYADGKRLVGAIVLMTFLSSGLYYQVNASRDAGLKRATSVLDKRIASESGFYQASFHLSMYYLFERKIDSMIVLWKNYVNLFPDDGDGYEKLIKSYWELGDKGFASIDETFREWSKHVSNDSAVRAKYAEFCLIAGNSAFQNGDLVRAEGRFREAARANPRLAGAYNNLGQVFLAGGYYDSALAYYSRSIAVDSAYALGYKNLGKIFLLKGEAGKAIDFYKKAIALQPGLISAYEEMASAYDAIGDRDRANELRKEAARWGGSQTAGEIVRERGKQQ